MGGFVPSASNIRGAPLFPEPAELVDARVLRDGLAGPGDGARQHLGEAETLAINEPPAD
jgi:hypothetical protein